MLQKLGYQRNSFHEPMALKDVQAVAQDLNDDSIHPSKSIIIFDWDDTLCPSSWIRDNRPSLSYFRPPPNESRFTKPLEELQTLVLKLLALAMTLGKVIIITNAQKPWATTSCRNFLPRVLPTLQMIPQIYAQNTWCMWEIESAKRRRPSVGFKAPVGRASTNDLTRVQSRIETGLKKNGSSVLAANNMYVDRLSEVGLKLFSENGQKSCQQEDDPSYVWKKLAFGVELTEFYSQYRQQSWSNVISIGDADYERAATKHVVECCSPSNAKKRAKTIKMFDDPTIEELIAQLEKLITILPFVVRHNDDIDIEIQAHDLEN